MSVDKTINDMSLALEEIRVLVDHVNQKIEGVTTRLNITLGYFDMAVAQIAFDANEMTTKVGNTVSQAPNAWTYYTIAICLILVLILLAVFLAFQIGIKCYTVYQIWKGAEPIETTEAASSNYGFSSPPTYDYSRRLLFPVNQQTQSAAKPNNAQPLPPPSLSYKSALSIGQTLRSYCSKWKWKQILIIKLK